MTLKVLSVSYIQRRFQKFASLNFLMVSFLVFSTATYAAEFDSSITMKDKGASTYYVPCTIEGYGSVDLMFDTGSSYMTINENMLEILQKRGQLTTESSVKNC